MCAPCSCHTLCVFLQSVVFYRGHQEPGLPSGTDQASCKVSAPALLSEPSVLHPSVQQTPDCSVPVSHGTAPPPDANNFNLAAPTSIHQAPLSTASPSSVPFPGVMLQKSRASPSGSLEATACFSTHTTNPNPPSTPHTTATGAVQPVSQPAFTEQQPTTAASDTPVLSAPTHATLTKQSGVPAPSGKRAAVDAVGHSILTGVPGPSGKREGAEAVGTSTLTGFPGPSGKRAAADAAGTSTFSGVPGPSGKREDAEAAVGVYYGAPPKHKTRKLSLLKIAMGKSVPHTCKSATTKLGLEGKQARHSTQQTPSTVHTTDTDPPQSLRTSTRGRRIAFVAASARLQESSFKNACWQREERACMDPDDGDDDEYDLPQSLRTSTRARRIAFVAASAGLQESSLGEACWQREERTCMDPDDGDADEYDLPHSLRTSTSARRAREACWKPKERTHTTRRGQSCSEEQSSEDQSCVVENSEEEQSSEEEVYEARRSESQSNIKRRARLTRGQHAQLRDTADEGKPESAADDEEKICRVCGCVVLSYLLSVMHALAVSGRTDSVIFLYYWAQLYIVQGRKSKHRHELNEQLASSAH